LLGSEFANPPSEELAYALKADLSCDDEKSPCPVVSSVSSGGLSLPPESTADSSGSAGCGASDVVVERDNGHTQAGPGLRSGAQLGKESALGKDGAAKRRIVGSCAPK
jgi:hypothetical protein